MSIITEATKSLPGQISEVEIKKWLINTVKYFSGVAAVALLGYLVQVQGGADFSMKNLGIALGGALLTSVIDVLHRYINDNTKPL